MDRRKEGRQEERRKGEREVGPEKGLMWPRCPFKPFHLDPFAGAELAL